MKPEPGQVTQLLARLSEGDRSAEEDLVPLIYYDLRRIAGTLMRREQPGITLQATVLVNDVLMKILNGTKVDWHDRNHFFAVAARQMRFILIDHARSTKAKKRADVRQRLPLDAVILISQGLQEELLEIDQALSRLATLYPRQAQVVEMRVFAGFTNTEIADILGTTDRNVKRYWAFARAWLYREINQPYPQMAQG